MNIALCDDDSISIEYLSSLCRNIALINSITSYTSPDLLLADIHTGSAFDVILMDIDFETQKNGIDYAEEIYHANPSARIIYITGYTERFAQNIFLKKSALTGFIIKPAQKDILEHLLQKAYNEINQDRCNLVCILGKGEIESIPCSTITYLESSGHKVLIHTEKGHDAYSVYERLSSFSKKLPESFLQCHKSYIINMDKIRRIDKKEIYLLDGSHIGISKSHVGMVKEHYLQYMQRIL